MNSDGVSRETLARVVITVKQLHVWFKPQPLNGQREKVEAIQSAGMRMAVEIIQNTEPSADQSASIRKVREAVLTACDAIRVHEVKSSNTNR